MIMAISAWLATNPSPTEDQLASNITNICRCGTLPRIRAAVLALSTSNLATSATHKSNTKIAPKDSPR
jgi:aerobic-type carbon monoxide dehydrogenase small subunit (CoxS/CutS family)